MMAISSSALFLALNIVTFLLAPSSFAAPTPQVNAAASSSSYWVSQIQRQGTVAFADTSFKIYRNVKDYGAVGDGSTDDTAAINNAITDGNRCGLGCDSTTVTPAIIYFPPGTYMVSTPIIQYYYTQFIGDALTLPTLKATAGFVGMAVIDADPYTNTGANWYTNQNNFFRQIRNFVIDLTAMPSSAGAGIHWQVAQATSLQNIRFEMVQGGGAANKQSGIFMDNGSGGFMTDLTFNGGNYGAFLGSQQFTTRNMTFNNCNTAIYMNWNWLWSLKSINVNNCQVGVDMANVPENQTVGSVLLSDSKFVNTPVAVNASFSQNSVPATGGTLVVDNVDFTGSATAVMSAGQAVLAGGKVVQSWGMGREYTGATGVRVQDNLPAPNKPAGLLGSNGAVFERAKPQYESLDQSQFVSVKSKGAKGDGITDDTQAIQNAMNGMAAGQVLYFDHGAYVITNTVTVPSNIKITGEIWPLIMASGTAFSDANNPKAVFQVGTAGQSGAVEISDLIFETLGPAPGAILMEWNLGASSQGSNGLWDTHFRIGGSAGTKLQSDTCAKNPNATHGANPACEGAALLFHATQSASVYVENCWFWVADHELDLADHNQIDIYNGRGVLIESQSPTWFYGTSAEHSVLYNYQLAGAKNVYMSIIQSETPYYQGNPDATAPFSPITALRDPDFSTASGTGAKKAWGLRVLDTTDSLIYGAGLYSFFENYSQDCVYPNNCQANMVSIEGSTDSSFELFGLSTKAAVNMITKNGVPQALDADNRSNFCATILKYITS